MVSVVHSCTCRRLTECARAACPQPLMGDHSLPADLLHAVQYDVKLGGAAGGAEAMRSVAHGAADVKRKGQLQVHIAAALLPCSIGTCVPAQHTRGAGHVKHSPLQGQRSKTGRCHLSRHASRLPSGVVEPMTRGATLACPGAYTSWPGFPVSISDRTELAAGSSPAGSLSRSGKSRYSTRWCWGTAAASCRLE